MFDTVKENCKNWTNPYKICKRYVYEYAKEVLHSYDLANIDVKMEKYNAVNQIIQEIEYGYISNNEAIKKLVNV